ncbi:MAG TPA: MFS transporter [Burkholderiales bacterium]|nr:MFS transporter [Burkholderiales bacterium]
MALPSEWRLAAFYFAHFAWGGIFVAYFPLYLAGRAFSPLEIAWVLALPQVARTLAPPAWGWLADRTGALRGIVVFSCLVSAVGYALIHFSDSFLSVALLVAVLSLLSAGALPLVEALTLGTLARDPGRYGPIRLWGSLGFIATLLGGGAWLDRYPVSTVPAAIATFCLAAFAVALVLPGARSSTRHEYEPLKITPVVALLLGAGFCMAVAHGTMYAFLSLHLEQQGYSGTAIGVLWTLGVVAEIFVFVALPALFRRFGLASILAFSFACAVVRFLAIGWLAHALWIIVVAQLLHAATFGAFHAASVAAVHRVFAVSAHARGQTLYSGVTYGAGGAVGALAAGWAWQAGGPGAAFTVSAIAGALGLLLAMSLKRLGL